MKATQSIVIYNKVLSILGYKFIALITQCKKFNDDSSQTALSKKQSLIFWCSAYNIKTVTLAPYGQPQCQKIPGLVLIEPVRK